MTSIMAWFMSLNEPNKKPLFLALKRMHSFDLQTKLVVFRLRISDMLECREAMAMLGSLPSLSCGRKLIYFVHKLVNIYLNW